MKQGTVSVIIGCHSPMHSFYCIKAWRYLYGRWPCPWEIICILVHDWGHWGTDYLDNIKDKERHWLLGAIIADRLFGTKGLKLVAGHCIYSKFNHSRLYKADKLAMAIASRWWMLWCGFIEPRLHSEERAAGLTLGQAVDDWRARVKRNIDSGEYRDNHEMYLERREEYRLKDKK